MIPSDHLFLRASSDPMSVRSILHSTTGMHNIRMRALRTVIHGGVRSVFFETWRLCLPEGDHAFTPRKVRVRWGGWWWGDGAVGFMRRLE